MPKGKNTTCLYPGCAVKSGMIVIKMFDGALSVYISKGISFVFAYELVESISIGFFTSCGTFICNNISLYFKVLKYWV